MRMRIPVMCLAELAAVRVSLRPVYSAMAWVEQNPELAGIEQERCVLTAEIQVEKADQTNEMVFVQ